jgi:uncharacterized membrane protein YjjP (DUF1212 family)
MATILPDSAVSEETEQQLDRNGEERPPSTHSEGQRAHIRRKHALVVRLGVALLSNGSPAYDFGRTMAAVAAVLELGEVDACVLPNTLFASFREIDHARQSPPLRNSFRHVQFQSIDEAQRLLDTKADERTHVIMATYDSTHDLSRLNAVAELASKLLMEDIAIQEAEETLLEIETMKRDAVWHLIDTFLAYPFFAAIAGESPHPSVPVGQS